MQVTLGLLALAALAGTADAKLPTCRPKQDYLRAQLDNNRVVVCTNSGTKNACWARDGATWTPVAEPKHHDAPALTRIASTAKVCDHGTCHSYTTALGPDTYGVAQPNADRSLVAVILDEGVSIVETKTNALRGVVKWSATSSPLAVFFGDRLLLWDNNGPDTDALLVDTAHGKVLANLGKVDRDAPLVFGDGFAYLTVGAKELIVRNHDGNVVRTVDLFGKHGNKVIDFLALSPDNKTITVAAYMEIAEINTLTWLATPVDLPQICP